MEGSSAEPVPDRRTEPVSNRRTEPVSNRRAEPVPDRRLESAITIQRADLEDLIGQAVRQEMAGQQAGPSSTPPEEGKHPG